MLSKRLIAAFVGAGHRSLALFERSEWATDGWCRRGAAAAFVGEVEGSGSLFAGRVPTKIPDGRVF